MKIILNDAQKRYIWDALDMAAVYDDDHKFGNFETAKNGEWRLDRNNDPDYPWSLFVVVDYWDDLTQEFVDKILSIQDNYDKMINLCESILTIAYDTHNEQLELLAHELKATLEIEFEEE